MAPDVVLDTSVILKWFRQGEILASQALAWRTAYLEGRTRVFIPTLLVYELANVLHYKSDLTTAQVEDAIQSLFDMGLECVSPTATAMRRAVVLAREFDVTAYDASFAALAELLGATFITADEQLACRLADLPSTHFLGTKGG